MTFPLVFSPFCTFELLPHVIFSGLPHWLCLPLPCTSRANANTEGGGGAGDRHGLSPVWWWWRPPSAEAASFCPAPAAGEDPMAQHPQHVPESQPGASQPGTPAHHCEARFKLLRLSLKQSSFLLTVQCDLSYNLQPVQSKCCGG